MRRSLLVLGLSLVFSAAALADITVSFVSATAISPDTYQFNYALALGPADQMDPAGITGATCATGGSPAPCLPSDTFVTIYDVPDLVVNGTTPSIGANAGWGETTQLVGITPVTGGGGSVNPPHGDSASLFNVTFYYTGGTVYCGSAHFDCTGTVQSVFSGFSITTSNSAPTAQVGSYTSSVANSPLVNEEGVTGIDAVNYGSGSVLVPVLQDPVLTPEPSTVWMLATVLLGLTVYGVWHRRSRLADTRSANTVV